MSRHNLHILVLEDDDFQRRMVANMCRSLVPSSISEATDGNHALQIISDSDVKPVNIVLCDLQMPGMDGMEFLRHLSNQRTGWQLAHFGWPDGQNIWHKTSWNR